MKKNLGVFKGDTYHKRVTFSKAVLWKDRQISLPQEIVKQFKPRGVQWVEFVDIKKNEKWVCDVDTLRSNYEYKQVGQEPQYYFPIELFKVTKYKYEANTKSKSAGDDDGTSGNIRTDGKKEGAEVRERETANHPRLFG